MKNRLFTSESVTEGHPDKICDQVSDAILDACFEQDRDSRVACECFVGKGYLLIGGEITTKAIIDPDKIARKVIADIGYTEPELGFCAEDVAINWMINTQSSDIALGVDTGGAGDQGIMFGYACNDTPELMPAPIQYAHKLAAKLAEVRKTKYSKVLKPDGKTQVTVEYDENNKLVRVHTILISTQHSDSIGEKELRRILDEHVIKEVIPKSLMDKDTIILVNPTGRFVTGGPKGDTGLTGRKIIVDSYGGYGRHGGGCWSGKDPTKVDRSASYAARYLAKNVVASGIANTCEIQLAYAIGVAKPVAIYVNTDMGNRVDREIEQAIIDNLDLTPAGIIKLLDLKETKYGPLAAYGHLGRDATMAPWENTNLTTLFKGL